MIQELQMNTKRGVDAEARAWIARLKSGDATTEDAEAFRAWRQQSAEHERALQKALQLWQLSGEAAAEQARPPSRRGVLLGGAGLLAASAGAYQAAAFLGHVPNLSAWLADQATAIGAVAPLDVAGAEGTLDGASAVNGGNGSRLRLVAGALYVHVGLRAEGKPALAVEAASLGASLTAGAAEIRFGDRGPEIACAEGQVQITAPKPMLLGAGETVSLNDAGTLLHSVQAPQEIAGWRSGILTFRRRRLGDALADLNRHRTGKVLLGRPLLAERQVSGVFHLDRPDEIVSHLVEGLRLVRRDLPGRLVLLS